MGGSVIGLSCKPIKPLCQDSSLHLILVLKSTIHSGNTFIGFFCRCNVFKFFKSFKNEISEILLNLKSRVIRLVNSFKNEISEI